MPWLWRLLIIIAKDSRRCYLRIGQRNRGNASPVYRHTILSCARGSALNALANAAREAILSYSQGSDTKSL